MQLKKHLSLKFSFTKASGLLFNEHQINEAKYFEKLLPDEYANFYTDVSFVSTFLDQFKIYKDQISEITCAISSPYAVLVPADLMEDNSEESCINLLNFHYKTVKGKCIKTYINSLGSLLVYSLFPAIEEIVLKYFPNAKLVHEQSVILEALIRERKFSSNNAIYILPEGENLSVYFFKDNSLQLFNQFFIKSAEDIGYYLVNIISSSLLNPAEVELRILGSLYNDNDLLEKLAKFFPNSQYFPSLSENQNIFDNSDFYLLQKQVSCVL